MAAETGRDPEKAAAKLREGKLVAIPTETVYGLAANALDEKAVAAIFTAKNRPSFDPLIVHCRDLAHAETFAATFPDKARQLAGAFWPGPLTLVLPKKSIIPDIVTAGNDTVGLRVPAHPLLQELLAGLEFPLAAPSANPFGYVSPTTAAHVAEQLGNKVDYILDGGPCAVGLESTIASVQGDEVKVLRLGGLSLELITEQVGEVKLSLSTHSNPQAPGQLDSHYAPRTPLWFGDIDELLQKVDNKENVGIISLSRKIDGIKPEAMQILSPTGDLEEAACKLFGIMRNLDKMKLKLIIAEKMPEKGLGRAINDRLFRACEK